MNETIGLDVLAMLADEVPDAPRLRDLMSLQRLADLLPLAVWHRGDLTPARAGTFVVRALLGEGKYAGRAPSRLPLYVAESWGVRELGDQEREPLRRDLQEYHFDMAFHRAGHPELPEAPRNQVSERTEALLRLVRWRPVDLSMVDDPSLDGRSWDGVYMVREDAFKAFGLSDPAPSHAPPTPAPAVVQSEPTPVPAAGSVIVDQQRSGPDLKHIAAVYLREVSIGQYGAINRAAAKLKRLDGEPMGRTTLVNRLKEANEAGIHTGYPPDR